MGPIFFGSESLAHDVDCSILILSDVALFGGAFGTSTVHWLHCTQFFNKTPEQLTRTMGVLVHGDEGRSKKRTHSW